MSNMKDGVKDGIKGIKKTFKNLKRLNKSLQKMHDGIIKMIKLLKMIFSMMKTIIFFVLSFPILLPIIIIVLIVGSFILSFYTGKNFDINKLNKKSIVITQQDLNVLGIETDEDGKVTQCYNNVTKDNIIFTSPLEGYIDTILKDTGTQKINYQYCIYHLLFKNYASGKYDLTNENIEIEELKKNLFNEGDQVASETIRQQIKEKEEKYNNITSILNKVGFIQIDVNRFRNYKNDEYGFQSKFNFPHNLFNNDQLFTNMMLNYHIGRNYSGVIGDVEREIFGIGGSGEGNLLNELQTIVIDSEEFRNYFVNNQKFDLINKVNSESYYYNFNCPPCLGEGCTCTGNPYTDFGADFYQDDVAQRLIKRYFDFILDLQNRRVIYVSEKIKSPFRNYTMSTGKYCEVDITLTQRDGFSNLKFLGFRGYPKVNGIPTHAGIDLVGISSCHGKYTPIFPILEGEVVFKSYDLTSWGHTIVLKSYIGGVEYFIRYSHLNSSPLFSVGDIVGMDDILGIQGRSGQGTGEHLDLTIHTSSNFSYSSYLRNTLELGGLFDITFFDLFTSEYSDYTIKSFTNYCSNCTN